MVVADAQLRTHWCQEKDGRLSEVSGMDVQVVESLRRGYSPQAAAEDAVKRVLKYHPSYVGAVIAIDQFGRYAAAAAGWTFEFAVRDGTADEVQTYKVDSISDHNRGDCIQSR